VIGCELNPKYVRIGHKRLTGGGMFSNVELAA